MIGTGPEYGMSKAIVPGFFFSLIGCLVFQPAAAKDAEDVFADALDYTVRVKSAFETPFIEDQVGVFNGAGFIVDSKRRWVMTNAHVAGHSPSKVQVARHGESFTSAEKIYVDPYLDLAILALDDEHGQSLPKAPLECDHKPGTGHPVGAFGHPWGLDYTGTQGVISGSTANFGGELLQTDAPINGGNSGGPLISLKSGAVIGINSSRLDNAEDQNTNFAVSMQHACRVLKLLADGKDPSPPELPLIFFDMAEETDPLIVAKSYLEPDLLALQANDEILFVDETPIANEGQLIHELRGKLDDITLTVRRDGEKIKLSGRLSPAPRVVERRGITFAGILLAPGRFRDQAMLGLGHDIMVHRVAAGSDGQASELVQYDYLVSINGVRITSLEHAYQTLMSQATVNPVRLDFLRIMGGYGEDYHLFYSVRREFTGNIPEKIGAWQANRFSRAE